MKAFDIIIVGGGRLGHWIASECASSGKTIALVELPGEPESYSERLFEAIRFTGVPDDVSVALVQTPVQKSPPSIPAEIFKGTATFLSPKKIQVGADVLAGKKFILASGSGPRVPSISGIEPGLISDVSHITKPSDPEAAALVVGGGPIGVAASYKLKRRRQTVTLLSRAPRLLQNEEPDVSDLLLKSLRNAGVRVVLGCDEVSVANKRARVRRNLKTGFHEEVLPADDIFAATGVEPNTSGLNLKVAGVYVDERGSVVTNDEFRTAAPHVWAAGPVTGAALNSALHWHQAALVSHNVTARFFDKMHLMPEPLPWCVPLEIPFARVGATEEEARNKFKDAAATVARWPLSSVTDDEGYVKVIGRKKTGQLLGAHLFCPHAGELLMFFDLLLRAEISLYDVLESHHFPSGTTAPILRQVLQGWTAFQ